MFTYFNQKAKHLYRLGAIIKTCTNPYQICSLQKSSKIQSICFQIQRQKYQIGRQLKFLILKTRILNPILFLFFWKPQPRTVQSQFSETSQPHSFLTNVWVPASRSVEADILCLLRSHFNISSKMDTLFKKKNLFILQQF